MLLNSFAAFAVVLRFAFFLHVKFDLNPSVTPLVSLAVLVDISIIAGMFNLLMPGVVFAYGLAVISLVWSVYRYKAEIKSKVMDFLTPGVIMFIVASVAIILFMFARKPLMTEWDEFSFWGISQKLVKIHGALYTFYKSSMIGNSTPPALAVLSYFFQWATPAFAEWASFAAYDVMFFACFSALTSCFDKDNWHMAFFVFLYGFVSPFVARVYTRLIYLRPVYMTTYADLPLGAMFGSTYALYFHSENKKSIWPLLPIIFMFTLTKDMGFAFCCIIAFMIFFDAIVGREKFEFAKAKNFIAKFLAAFVVRFTSLCAYVSWSYHMSRVMQRNPFELGGAANMGYAEMLITGFGELLHLIPQSEKFIAVENAMINAFFSAKINMIGSGFRQLIVITIVFAIAFFLNDKKGKIRTIITYITSVIGFVGYYIFHLFLYVYIFKDNGLGLVSYNRYMYPYYMGWLCFGIIMLCNASKGRLKKISDLAIIGFTITLFSLFTYYASFENIFVECNNRSFITRMNVIDKSDLIKESIKPDDVLYLYSTENANWFMYTYELAPNYVMEEFALKDDSLNEEEYRLASRDYLRQQMKNAGVTAVILDNSSESFANYYGDWFGVNPETISKYEIRYYSVEYTEDSVKCTLEKSAFSH